MKNKYRSMIIFTVAFALTVAISVICGTIGMKNNNTVNVAVTDPNGSASINNLFSPGGETDNKETDPNSINRHPTGNGGVNSPYNEIMEQFKSHETVFNSSNVGGNNPIRGGVKYELDGQTVTTVYETETTTVRGETTATPETTTTPPDDTDKEPVTVAPPEITTVPDTTSVPETTTSPETTEVTTEDTTEASTTEADSETETELTEETTGISDEETTAEPVDNSQTEVVE